MQSKQYEQEVADIESALNWIACDIREKEAAKLAAARRKKQFARAWIVLKVCGIALMFVLAWKAGQWLAQ